MEERSWQTVESWMERYGDSILRTIYLVTRDRELSEELAQEVFIRAYRKLGQFRGSSSPSTWLHRIAVNLAKNSLRRRRPDRLDPELLELHEDGRGWARPERAAIDRDRVAAVQRGVAALPDRLRPAVALYYLEERPLAEVAKILRLPQGTVKSRLHQARGQLRLALGGIDG